MIDSKEVIKLDKQTYNTLKSEDFRELEWHILELLRSGVRREEHLSFVVAITAMALVSKETSDRTSMMNYLENSIGDETTITFLKKVEKEFNVQIKEISDKYEKDTLKAATLFTESRRPYEADNSTPEGISELAIALLNINENDVILDLGSGVNSFLIQAAFESGNRNLYGVEVNTSNVIIANIRRCIVGLPINTIQGNVISQEFTYLSANKVLSNHSLGVRLSELQKYADKNPELKKYFKNAKRTVTADWVFNIAAFLNTKQPGRTVVLMTNAGTWNKADENIRKRLLEEGTVEGVIQLPERLLSYTMAPLTMIVFSQNNKTVKMVDASKIYTEKRRQNELEPTNVEKIIKAYHEDTEISKKVTIAELAEQEYILNPQRYIGPDIGIENGILLGDLCLSINRGAMISSDVLDELVTTDETNYHYLMLQNISEGAIDPSLPNLIKIENKYQKHCINNKNLIISKISPFKVAMAHVKENESIVANGNLYFIELDENKVNPIFVQVFLLSEIGMAQLNRLAKGSLVKNISIQDLKKIQIPDLPRVEQDRIAEEYENLSDELTILQKQMDIVRDKKANILEGVI